MGNPLAIAAVTSTLRNTLARVAIPLSSEPDAALSDTQVTTVPPDKAGLTDDHNQLNLFLYQILPSPSARNLNGKGVPGGLPALALELYFLVTAYGRSSSDILAHRLIGRAMSLLHSYPGIAPADIAAAIPGSGLEDQIDQVRINPHPLANEEMVRLWSNFQTKFRLSVAYRVAVVLIDNERTQTDAAAVKTIQITAGAAVGGASP